MEFARKYKDVLVNMYVDEQLSTYEIAEKLNTYPNKILNALKFLGVPRRGYGEAQKAALTTGRAEHPTKGKVISEENRRKAGRARAAVWASMTDSEKERVSQISRENWVAMSEADKAELFRLAAEAVRETSKEGSKLERFITEELRKDGWTVQFHYKGLLANAELELDMFLPEIRTAIEIDGPAHFLPIWGEQKLQKHQQADAEKAGLLLSAGYVLLRVKQIDKSMSVTKMENVLEQIKIQLKNIENKFPSSKNRLIELEVVNGQVK